MLAAAFVDPSQALKPSLKRVKVISPAKDEAASANSQSAESYAGSVSALLEWFDTRRAMTVGREHGLPVAVERALYRLRESRSSAVPADAPTV